MGKTEKQEMEVPSLSVTKRCLSCALGMCKDILLGKEWSPTASTDIFDFILNA